MKLLVDSHGYNITVDTGLDLSSLSVSFKVRIERPDGVDPRVIEQVLNHSAVASTSGGSSTIRKQIFAGDLPVEGRYELQVIDITGGAFIESYVGVFKVVDRIPDPS